MAKTKYDRWLLLDNLDNFKDEKFISCYTGYTTNVWSGFFGRFDYFKGYITIPPYRYHFTQRGESLYKSSTSCIIIEGREDSLLLISDVNHFKLNRNIKRTHFEPPKNYWGKVDNSLLSWAKLFNSENIRKIYGIQDIVIVDSLFAKQFKIRRKTELSTQRLAKKIKLHLEL